MEDLIITRNQVEEVTKYEYGINREDKIVLYRMSVPAE